MNRDDEWGDDDWDDDGVGDGGTYESQASHDDRYSSGSHEMNRPQQSTGMSTGLKIVIGLLITGGVVFLCCIGIGIYFMKSFVDGMEMSENPADVRAATQSIVDIDIPEEEFPPIASMKMNLFVMVMKMAVYGDEDGGKMLMLAEGIADGALGKDFEDGMEQGMRNSMNEQGQNTDMNITKTDKRDFTIRGEECTFVFNEGTLTETGDEVIQVLGSFPGNEGRAFVLFNIRKDAYDEESVVKIIESIK